MFISVYNRMTLPLTLQYSPVSTSHLSVGALLYLTLCGLCGIYDLRSSYLHSKCCTHCTISPALRHSFSRVNLDLELWICFFFIFLNLVPCSVQAYILFPNSSCLANYALHNIPNVSSMRVLIYGERIFFLVLSTWCSVCFLYLYGYVFPSFEDLVYWDYSPSLVL